MASAPRRKEVSCLALTFFYDYLEEHGVPRLRLQEGMPYPPEYLNSRINWIDYGTFLAIERRMAELVPRPDLFYDIGRTFAATRGFGFLRVIFRSFLSPQQVYKQLPRTVGRFLFPFVHIEFYRERTGGICARYTFDEGYEPSDAFLDTVRGILTGVPNMTGAPDAQVTMQREGTNVAVYDIELGKQSPLGLFAPGSILRRMTRTGQMWWRNLSDAAGELEETNRLLQEQVDALTDAKAELDRRVRDLTILDTVSRAAVSGALDLQRVLQNVVGALSMQLGDVPVAVLLAEGEPPRLVLAATALFPRALEDAIPHERLASVLETAQPLVLEVGGRRVRVQPMSTGRAVIAALATADLNPAEDGLLDTVAKQFAFVIENAISFQTISDLRDNLELRVRERTTELEEAHDQLEDTIERLKRSDRARTEFFTNVSHELRTPLTLILAPLDTIESSLRDPPPEVQANLRLIRDNAHTLLRLINEILDFARIDAERMPLRPEKVELGELIDDTVASLRPLADRKRVGLEWQRPSGSVSATADPKLLRRALFNLISNGIKFVEEGQRVSVTLSQPDKDVEVVVSDNGPGIPRESQTRLFERFQRVPDAKGRIIEGSGIGLAMVKEIVQLHHGTISLESDTDQGATFRIRMPRERLAAQPSLGPAPPLPDELMPAFEPTPVPAAPVIPAPSPDTNRGTVLLVEDNREMRDFLTRLLSPHYQLLIAEDGLEGLRLAQEHLPDGIISDVMMPKLDGISLCRQLKDDRVTRIIPIILVSARHGAEAALEGFAAGANDYVVKPFSSPELLARIDAQLRLRRLSLAVMRMEKQTTLGLLAAGIAHEVRNPVNAVINAVPPLRRALLERGGDQSKGLADALLESIDRSGHRIRHIVDAMLALSRQEPDRLTLREVHLSEGIESTLAILRYRISDGVTIHQEYGWDGDLWCYPDLVNQVVMNLIVNALDSVDPRRGNIWIRLVREGEEVRLEVSDDGPGVSSELRERIFEPFFTTKPPGAGTGLGLAISREVASLHGGSLELVSRGVHRGATFVLRLPLERGAQPFTGPLTQGSLA
jgi:signal transduction histidine kinase